MANQLQNIISTHIAHHFDRAKTVTPIEFTDRSLLDELLIGDVRCNDAEFFIFLLALLPHTKPHYLTQVIQEELPQGGDFPEIGGVRVEHFRGIIPTVETALFFLKPPTGDARREIFDLFEQDHFFYTQNILTIEPTAPTNPFISSKIILSDEVVHKLLFAKEYTPKFSSQFPAKKITTSQSWNDLVLNKECLEGIKEIKNWVRFHERIQDDKVLGSKIKRGYRVLFYGPPGTGKTLTAALLGKEFERLVFKVDLSSLVSKYIGETEKNLSKLLDIAAGQNWILMFDEADSLFGKRTTVNDAHDRYANQGTSYLLQRIEDFNGLVILTSNLKSNIDKAFMRRFQTIVQFNLPDANERMDLWKKMMPDGIAISKKVDINEISRQYELTGGNIINVIQKAALTALQRDGKKPEISMRDIRYAIRQEFLKEDRIFDA